MIAASLHDLAIAIRSGALPFRSFVRFGRIRGRWRSARPRSLCQAILGEITINRGVGPSEAVRETVAADDLEDVRPDLGAGGRGQGIHRGRVRQDPRRVRRDPVRIIDRQLRNGPAGLPSLRDRDFGRPEPDAQLQRLLGAALTEGTGTPPPTTASPRDRIWVSDPHGEVDSRRRRTCEVLHRAA
jgi:hypothetical protein